MKIEMGESLFYSWLRHVKECQVVQTNWKPSPSWQLHGEEEIKRFMSITDEHFQNKYGYAIYKNNSLSQLLMQAEVDALGISMSDDKSEVYAIDVAFHESGLNYGDRQETVMRVIKKFIRTALCLIGYFDITRGEIIFASPKIHNAIINDLEPSITDLNTLLIEYNYNLTARVIANDDFNEIVLEPIIIASNGISDTSELFMRGYQLIKMFGDERRSSKLRVPKIADSKGVSNDKLSELKIGKIAQTFLREALESGKADDEEINLMRSKEYSKSVFGIDFPLLVLASEEFDSVRYYAKPLVINGVQYHLCSQWYEVPANNDRPFLLSWLERHGSIE
ncbi:MAG: hypothetical protein KGZ79_12015 [Dethiobacter sp.]|jgi:hypothetical protein|nr:hypothetical protein [Dethiobacter sp.]